MDLEVADNQISEGEFAPDFIMTDSDGKTTKLSDLRKNKKAVVYFYPKDFTPGCTTQAKEFTRDYVIFKNLGIEIIGISPDHHESHIKFRETMRIPYTLVADPEHKIAKRYGVYGLKKFMGKEYLGVNRSTFVIDENGRIIKIFSNVKPAGHSQGVMEVCKSNNG